MTKCPFCKESIQDDAVKCRHCSSWLLPYQPVPETKEKPAGLDEESNRVHYILDTGLIKFGKFVIAILALFITIGAFLWGFDIKNASDLAHKAQDSIARYSDLIQKNEKNIEKSLNDINRLKSQIKTINDTIKMFRDSAFKGSQEIQQFVHSAFNVSPIEPSQGTVSKDKPINGPSFTGQQVAKLYDFPTNLSGAGQTIALIELGGGYRINDLKSYFKSLDIKLPSIRAVSVNGGKNSPSTPASNDGQVMLDIEVAGSVAPDAKLVVYFSANTDKSFLDAINNAIHDKPSVIAISWGGAEPNWTQQSLKTYNETLKKASVMGITVCVAAGDNGSKDNIEDGKVHVDFPASSPFVLACGGTTLTVKNSHIISEVAWRSSNNSTTGGGVSEFFPLPAYQATTGIPRSFSTNFKGRGIPDVSGVADPNTGYKVLVDGQNMVIGGTAGTAPLIAGFIALINQGVGRNVGFINPILYGNVQLHTNGFRDITKGNNRTGSNNIGYNAGVGWDACTGWGSLDGEKFIAELSKIYKKQ